MSTLHRRRGPVRHALPHRGSPARRLPGLGLGIALAFLLAVPGLAHAELATSSPKDGAVLASPPTSIRLTFTEGLDAGKSSIQLTGPNGVVGSAKPARDGATVITLDTPALVPGAYTVKWTSAAPDGHIERGSISFTVSEPTPAPASPTPAATAAPSVTGSPATPAPSAPPATVAPSAAPSAEASVVPAQPASAPGSPSDVLLPIVVGLVLVGGVGAFVLRRSRGA